MINTLRNWFGRVLMTWVVLYPLLLASAHLIWPLMSAWSLWFRLLATSFLLVTVMQAVTPLLARLFTSLRNCGATSESTSSEDTGDGIARVTRAD